MIARHLSRQISVLPDANPQNCHTVSVDVFSTLQLYLKYWTSELSVNAAFARSLAEFRRSS